MPNYWLNDIKHDQDINIKIMKTIKSKIGANTILLRNLKTSKLLLLCKSTKDEREIIIKIISKKIIKNKENNQKYVYIKAN